MVHVIAVITARPGQRSKVLQAFQANMPAVHAEAGCIEYQPVVDVPQAGPIQTPLGDGSFIVVEKWESLDHLKAHAAAPHMAAYAATVKDWIAERRVHVLHSAAGTAD